MTAPPIFGDIGSSPAMPTFLALLHTIGKYPRRHLQTLQVIPSSEQQTEHHFYLSCLTQLMGCYKSLEVWKLVVSVRMVLQRHFCNCLWVHTYSELCCPANCFLEVPAQTCLTSQGPAIENQQTCN